MARDDGSLAAACQADYEEMARLLATCHRSRVRKELLRWLERRQDAAEMASLLSSSKSQRLLSELRPWLGEDCTDSSTMPPPEPSQDIPTVLLLGDRDLARQLLRALTLQEDAADVAVGILENKYYSVRLQYRVLASAELPGNLEEAVATAEAVILVWDVHHPQPFYGIKDVIKGSDDPEAEEADEGTDRVQLCLAVDNGSSEAAFPDQEEVWSWCLEHGYEMLQCPLRSGDLQALRHRVEGARQGRPLGLLSDESDGTVIRVLEALECHASWTGLEPKARSTQRTVDEQSRPAAVEQAPGLDAIGDSADPHGSADAEAGKSGYQALEAQDDEFDAAEEFEKLAGEMKDIRNMEDHAARKERACEVALRLASTLGIDSDSD
ncbi:Aste57867_9313 [Symbiodinium sp. CCMP2592]|nr:Aste57867_9313 [Symbiodinium sp. CCMP2592]